MRLSRYSIGFGIVACLGLPFNPPVIGCLGGRCVTYEDDKASPCVELR